MATTPLPQVLVVDDDDATRAVVALALRQTGYEVALAANGREALDLLRQGPRQALILLDLLMPVMDGWRFLEEQRGDPRLADIPVIVLSAAGDIPRLAADLGPYRYVEKPLLLDELLEAVDRLTPGDRW
jgi:CheY-like chemotaxis protein